MTTVVLAPAGTTGFQEGGGHWWVFLQYLLSLRDLGCRVVWLERCSPGVDIRATMRLLDRFGVPADDVLLYETTDPLGWLHGDAARLDAVAADAELLLDIDYGTPPAIVDRFARSALVDIDPGLLQFWWSVGQLVPARHDRWVTTGETVGTAGAPFPDCGVDWHHIRPPVHLPSWPVAAGAGSTYTTVTSWWGDEWLTDGVSTIENNKRVAYLEYLALPTRTPARLEIAACFGGVARADDPGIVVPDEVGGDGDDVRALLAQGWQLRRSGAVSADPFAYRDYVSGARGEFSCVKPSCVLFQNAWISDRSLCYLASGRPVVVQHTGPSQVLDSGEGIVRFTSLDEAVAALADVEARYDDHRNAARSLVEAHFDGRSVLGGLLDELLR